MMAAGPQIATGLEAHAIKDFRHPRAAALTQSAGSLQASIQNTGAGAAETTFMSAPPAECTLPFGYWRSAAQTGTRPGPLCPPPRDSYDC